MSNSVNFSFEGPSCPLPIHDYPAIVLGHGSGGQMTQALLARYFLPAFANPALLQGNDFASVPNRIGGKLALSTDAHIVSPLFFAGGDIGRLAISGTVNDISMSGGTPLCLTASFIIEEGFSTHDLEKIIKSMSTTALESGVPIIAGDTKVVERGKADGLFISTTGLAWIPEGISIGGAEAKPGDAILISGTIGEHGISVLSARGNLGLESGIQSDVAPLNHLIDSILKVAPDIHVLRDPTRGGLATTLNEIARQSHMSVHLDESAIPVLPEVRIACEMLGFDPLYVANEGKVIVILPQESVDDVLDCMHNNRYGKNAALIGTIQVEPVNRVLLNTRLGTTRVLDILAGEMLPRIC